MEDLTDSPHSGTIESASLVEAVEELNEVIGLLLLATIKGTFLSDVPGSVAQCVLPMLHAMYTSTASVLLLDKEEHAHLRDCYPITRSIVETGINTCFILAGGNEIAERALRHSFQKAYRDADRSGGGFHVRLIDLPPPEKIPGMQEALREFSTKSGAENRSWISASVDERIEKIGEEYGQKVRTCLFTARFLIYRPASEVIHGTFHGAVNFLGAARMDRPPPKGEEGHKRIRNEHETTIFGSLLYCQAGLLLALERFLQQEEGEQRGVLSKAAMAAIDKAVGTAQVRGGPQ